MESDGKTEEGKVKKEDDDESSNASDDEPNEGIYYDAISTSSALEAHGNKSQNNEADSGLNQIKNLDIKNLYEPVSEADKYLTAKDLSLDNLDFGNTKDTEQSQNNLSYENTDILDILEPNETQNKIEFSSDKENPGCANDTNKTQTNSAPLNIKKLTKKFTVVEEPSQDTGSSYCLAKQIDSSSDQYCLAKPVVEEEDEDYIKANKVDKALIRKQAYKYKYDPPWNDEFPVVMVQKNVDQNKESTTEGQGQAITQSENQGETSTEVPLDQNKDTNDNIEESGKYNHLFEGSISEEPENINMYGKFTPLKELEFEKEKSEGTNQPLSTSLEIRDSSFVPALPILISSGVYSNAYEGNVTNSMGRASIRSQDTTYEEVKSRASEDVGWNSSEFEDSSDSSTDYENPPDSDFVVFDKPLPPTPKELAKTHPEVIKKKKEDHNDTHGGSSQFLPVKVNLVKHPPPCLPPAPEGLENHQVKRRYAIQSLIDTEKTYIDTLGRLSEEYKEPLITTHGLQGTPVDVILTKAERILDIHKMFQIELAEKVQKWDKEQQIGNIFTGFFSREMVIDLYSSYVNNFSVAMEELKVLQSTKPALASFLTEKAMKSVDRLPLFGLLVKPVQRFPQFITMMQDLLKHTPHQHHDRSSLQTALTDLENVAHQLNESKRLTEQKLQAKKFIKELNMRNFKAKKLLRQDDLDQICETGNVRTKARRLFLTDSYLICTTVTHREQDGKPVDRIRSKWAIPLTDLELKDNAISPDLSCSVKMNGGLLSIHTKKESIYQETDPLNLQNDLEDMVHDYTILGQISAMVASLKCSYTNLPEEMFDEIISDLQRKIQVKNQQLQILNSCTVVVEHTNNQNNRKEKYVFQTFSPELKQEWSTDFLLAKLALDPINNPSWTSLSSGEDVTKQPALFMKHLPVDMPRYFTKMKCAVPVYLASHGSSDIGIQHLWVVMTTDLRTQVALVSVQNTRPSLVEAFQASQAEVVAVEIVPGFATKESDNAFTEDTVWMSTVSKQVLIFSVFNEQGLRDQTKLNRIPKKVFHCHGIGQQIHYTIERVFIGTDEGVLVIYDRNEEGAWNFDSPSVVQLASSSINSIISLDEEVWVACGQDTYIIPVEESYYLEQIEMSCKEGGNIAHMVRSGVGLWISHHDSSSIHLYHIETKKHLQEINVVQSVNNLVQGNPDMSLGQGTNCTITSLMASKGFLWVGTSLGVLLAFPLPRLKDGVPIISGRPFVSYHGHNGPIQFLIPIYCGTVNLWHKARGLDYNTMDLRRQNTANSEHTQVKTLKGYEQKRHSSSDIEKTVSQISLEGDYVKMSQQPLLPAKPRPDLKLSEKKPGDFDKDNRLSRSADDITKLLPSKPKGKMNDRGKTLKFPTKLASRPIATKTLNRMSRTGEDDVNEVYRDLMRNESMTSAVKPQIQEKEKSTRSTIRKPSFTFRRGTKSTKASVRVSTDEPKLRALDTLSKRGCNSVMMVMGGDGYIDWRKKSSTSFKNSEAALIMWLYKY